MFRSQNSLSFNPAPAVNSRRPGPSRGKDPSLTISIRQGDTRPALILTLARNNIPIDVRDAQDTAGVLHVLEPKTRHVMLELKATFANLYMGNLLFPDWPYEWTSCLDPGSYPCLVYLHQNGSQESANNEIWLEVQRAGVHNVTAG